MIYLGIIIILIFETLLLLHQTGLVLSVKYCFEPFHIVSFFLIYIHAVSVDIIKKCAHSVRDISLITYKMKNLLESLSVEVEANAQHRSGGNCWPFKDEVFISFSQASMKRYMTPYAALLQR